MTDQTMQESPATLSDPRPLFDAALATAGSVVGGVETRQLSRPTPCPEFDVRRLLGHLLAVLERIAVAGEGGDILELPIVVEGVADDGWAAAWKVAEARVRGIWADPSLLARPTHLPWADLPGAGVLVMYTNELIVHAWDLARATGQTPAWDDRAVGMALDGMRRFLPGSGRVAQFEAAAAHMPPQARPTSPSFLDAVPVPDDAPLIDQLVAWSGRRP